MITNVKVKHYKITGPSKSQRRIRFFRRWGIHLLPLPLLALIPAAKAAPYVVELIFSRKWYSAVAYTYGFLTSLVPFSLTEFGILALTGICIWLLIREIRFCWRTGSVQRFFQDVLFWSTRFICGIVALFMVLCGFNYYRVPFAESCGLTIQDSSPQELYALCMELGQEANQLREQVPENNLGVTELPENSFRLAKKAREAFENLSGNPTLPNYPISPKPVLNSWAMSLMEITGVFCPITFEANVNIDAPDHGIPASMCHELAHTRGHMHEDEANFIAYLACRESPYPEFRYSGVMLALSHASSRLRQADPDLYQEWLARLSGKVLMDFRYESVYWARFQTPVGDVSTAVNHAYLQLNSQKDGVQSYGRMVDLLLADYRARNSGESQAGAL